MNINPDGVEVIIDWIKEVSPESNPKVLKEIIKFSDLDRTIPSLCF